MPAVFFRNDWTGEAEVRVGDQVRTLQSPRDFATHFSFSTRTVVQKVRPRVFGGLRANSFVVRVDGRGVAEATGK